MDIAFHKAFRKEFKKLPNKTQERFLVRLELFKVNALNPILNNHDIHHPYEGCRSINVSGDYRAVYRAKDDTVTFLHIGTHSELYK